MPAPKLPPITSTAAQAALTLLATTPFVIVNGWHGPSTAAGAWSLVFIAVFPSVLSYLLWNRALEVIEPGRAGVYLNLLTVFTAAAAVLSGQGLEPSAVVGGVLVIGGVALTSQRSGAA